MKNDSGSTHREHAVDPKTFRAAATGIGQTLRSSIITGGMRAQRVVDTMPAHQYAVVPDNEGYPTPTPQYDSNIMLVAGVKGR